MVNNQYGENFIGNVIRIIDHRTLLVNVGSSQLQIGDIIQVYEPGPEIFDINGNSLGNYEFIKDTLKVIETDKLFSVCQKQEYEENTRPYENMQLALSPLFMNRATPVPLKIVDTDIEPLTIKDSFIHVGDPIKVI